MEHRNLSDDHYATFSSLMGLAKAYIHMGDYEKAREWRAKLPKTEADGK